MDLLHTRWAATFVTLLVAASAFLLFIQPAQAQFSTPVELSGYAWSSNIGWISFNCNNGGMCGSSDYAVTIQPNHSLSGYAWSSNIGWIQFGGLSGCPGGSCAATFNVVSGELSGWGRALSYGGGWDGWISLSCSNTGDCGTSDYKVNLGSGVAYGYSWGGEVVGWIDWFVSAGSGVTYTPPCSAGTSCLPDGSGREETTQWCETTITACGPDELCSPSAGHACIVDIPSGTLTPAESILASGESTELTWTVTTATPYPISCRVTRGSTNIVTGGGANGTVDSGTIENAVVFELFCTNSAGTEYSIDTAEVRSRAGFEEL